MSHSTMTKYPAECQERAVKLAGETDQPMAQTARDLGVNENTGHPWIGTSHRVERQAKQGNDEHLYEDLTRLRQEHTRWQEEREIVKQAAASCAQQLP
jgi:transposase